MNTPKPYLITYSDLFKEQVDAFRKSGDKTILLKLDKLLSELREHPYWGTGSPEPLKYNLKGKWSRRITGKHRLIYEVDEYTITVFVVSALGHYGDK